MASHENSAALETSKRKVSHIEKTLDTSSEEVHPDELSEEECDKTFRKVDFHLMPMLMSLYLIANLDRANVGNAKVEGLEADLNMTGNDYNLVNMIFFVPYIICEVPANTILTKFKRPSLWLGFIVTAWGFVMTFSGFCSNFAGLMVCRVLLGVFEAGFFPGAVWLLAQWYPPKRTQFRMSLLYCAAAMSGAFSGLLAAGIAKMSGIAGYNGWRWIFILEGVLTIALGVAAFFILPDSPSHSGRWLSSAEIRYLNYLYNKHRRGTVNQDQNAEGESSRPKSHDWKTLRSVLLDWQIYLQALIFMSSAVPTYALKFTLPQIMVNMGFSNTNAQLLSAPPYICGAISALVVSKIADRFFWRFPFIVGPQLSLMAAYCVLFSFSAKISSNVALCYTFVHMATISVYPIIPGGNTWTVNNVAGPTKRAMGVALMIALGNCGGIIGSLIFVGDEKPRYQTGWGTCIAFICLGICSACTLEVVYMWNNKKRDRKSKEEVEAEYSPDALEQMGDRSPLFRYTL